MNVGVASATGDFFAGFIGGLIAVLLFGRRHPSSPAAAELAMMAEVRRQQLSDMDVMNLKSIATSLEEYAVDHNGRIRRNWRISCRLTRVPACTTCQAAIRR